MSGYDDPHRYDDIIHLPHHQSATRPHMSMHDRAAQFAPFAALTGYGEAIAETARLTEERMELDEYRITALDRKLQTIREHIPKRPVVSVTYFRPDDRKSGGAYLTRTGSVKKLDDYRKELIFEDETRVFILDITEICEEGQESDE